MIILSLIEIVNKKKLNVISAFVSISRLSLLGLFFLGCASRPPQTFGVSEAILIQTKAQIKNNNETNTVKIEIALLPQKAIRLEITGTLGVSVATVLMTPTEIIYALHATKQFAVGPFHEKTLYPLFKKNMDPRLLWRIINNQALTNLNFNCENNAELLPVKCINSSGTTIKWAYEAHPRKKIDIINNSFEMNWIFREQSLLQESQNKTFVLKKPVNYQEIIIK